MFSRLFNKTRSPRSHPSTEGRLIYAVGDVHGHLDALDPLIKVIGKDALASSPAERPLLIFVGDYVDRGPASAGVVDLILSLKAQAAFEVHCLKGNHEEALLQFLGEPGFGPTWAEYGGAATLASYGVHPPTSRTDTDVWDITAQAFAAVLPPAHLAFYQSLELMITVGDYGFVHAGIRPGIALDDQTERDLLWIRNPFLEWTGRHEKIIVHGHTPLEAPQLLPNRIGIDTGVYATGILTAVRLDETGATILQARAPKTTAMPIAVSSVQLE